MNLSQTSRAVAIAGIGPIVLRVIGAALTLAVTFVITRDLSPAMAGEYFFAVGTVLLASVIGRLGADLAALRHIAGIRDADPRSSYRSATSIAVAGGSFVTLLLLALAPLAARLSVDAGGWQDTLRICALAVIPMTLSTVNSGTLKALGHVRESVVVQVAIPPSIALILATTALSPLTSSRDMAVAFSVSWLLTSLVSTAWVLGRLRRARVGSQLAQTMLSVLKTGMPLWASSVLGAVVAGTDVVMLGLWTSTSEVGLYAVAVRIAGAIAFIVFGMNAAAGPELGKRWVAGNLNGLSKTASAYSLVTSVLAAVPTIVLVVMSTPILFFFGDEYVAAQATLLVLTVGFFTRSWTAVCSQILIVTGNGRRFRNATALGAIVNVLLNMLLIPTFGALGAAIGTALSFLVTDIASLIQVRRHVGIHPTFWSIASALRNGSAASRSR